MFSTVQPCLQTSVPDADLSWAWHRKRGAQVHCVRAGRGPQPLGSRRGSSLAAQSLPFLALGHFLARPNRSLHKCLCVFTELGQSWYTGKGAHLADPLRFPNTGAYGMTSNAAGYCMLSRLAREQGVGSGRWPGRRAHSVWP